MAKLGNKFVRQSETKKRCLEAFRRAKQLIGMDPSAAEVAQQMGLTRMRAYVLMCQLSTDGKLLRVKGRKSRCFTLPQRQPQRNRLVGRAS